MIQSSTFPSQRIASVRALQPMMVQRRRALRVAPPAGRMIALPADGFVEVEETGRNWQDDLRFFLACYAAGMLFFLVMLS
jgi:hypothetical protein